MTVVTSPSKLLVLVGGEYLFRSDSNAEDLDGFAGAGLYDPIPVVPSAEVPVEVGAERWVPDDACRGGAVCPPWRAVRGCRGGPGGVAG